MAALVKSLKDDPEFLSLREIIAYDHVGELIIIGGNMRYRALKEMGVETADVKVISGDVSAKKLRSFVIKDNVPFGENDWDLLANEWEEAELEDWGMKIEQWKEPNKSIGDDDVSGVQEKTISQPGELFELGKHLLYCGDSTIQESYHRLMGTEKADMVFSDPPYGVSIGDKNKMLANFRKGGIESNIENDTKTPDELKSILTKVFKNVYEVMNDCCACFTCSPQGGELCMMMMMMMMSECNLATKHIIIWVKNNATFSMNRLDYDYKHEPILFTWKKTHKKIMKGEQRTSVWNYDKPQASKLHPTMKPVELIVNAILNNSDKGDIILDPFGGSGTTLIGSEKTGRICRMIELDPHYCDVIRRRYTKWCLDNNQEPGSGALE
jgi:DNA modification methylase